MCQDIQKVTFLCGHQVSFWWGKSRFCLFTGAGAERFHTTYVSFGRDDEKCPRCKIIEQIKQRGRVMKRHEFRQAVEEEYAKTADSSQEERAKEFESLAQKARNELTAAKISELQLQIEGRIAFYLGKDNVTPGGKTVLLRTIIGLPEVFDRQQLVEFFASRYFKAGEVKTLEDWEKRKLLSIARHARLDTTLRRGLKLANHVPLLTHEKKTQIASLATMPQPVQHKVASSAVTTSQSTQQKEIEEGLTKLSLKKISFTPTREWW
ncbi:hypothetical protein F5Y12DRAFT_716317 [Xylaria sp. FL1777]|nr:hypothetical protein F5Y12DRAFT_716317 [Xylaria sp. FL1777]